MVAPLGFVTANGCPGLVNASLTAGRLTLSWPPALPHKHVDRRVEPPAAAPRTIRRRDATPSGRHMWCKSRRTQEVTHAKHSGYSTRRIRDSAHALPWNLRDLEKMNRRA